MSETLESTNIAIGSVQRRGSEIYMNVFSASVLRKRKRKDGGGMCLVPDGGALFRTSVRGS